jgi:hypothetical protein
MNGIFVVWLFAALIFNASMSAGLAEERGRSGTLWAVLGFVFGPMALLAVGLSRPLPRLAD